VRALGAPLPGGEGAWLEALGVASVTAHRELTWATRAIGLIVASRDALDDLTVSEVTHALERATTRDPGWIERCQQYLGAHAERGAAEPVVRRLARVLLAGAGVDPHPAALEAAGTFLARQRIRLNGELGRAFGVANLPDDLPPSAAVRNPR
jgi:hypothetical protein